MNWKEFIQSVFGETQDGVNYGSMTRVTTFIAGVVAAFVTVWQVIDKSVDHALLLELWGFAIASKNIGKYLENQKNTKITE